LVFDANCRLKISHKSDRKRRSSAKISLLSSAENIMLFILGFVGVFIPQVSALETKMGLLPPADTCSLTSISQNYQTLKTQYAANVQTKLALAQTAFTADFGFQAADNYADLKKQMATVSSSIDKQLSTASTMVDALTYFTRDNPGSFPCPNGIMTPKCTYYAERIMFHYAGNTYPSTLDAMTAELKVQTALKTSLTTQKTNITNDQNYISAGDSSDLMEAVYASTGIVTTLVACFSDILAILKTSFLSKITSKLVDAAATLVANLLGVGIIKLIAQGLVTLVKIIADVHSYIKATPKQKPTLIGAIVGEVAKFVINIIRRKKLRKF